MKFIPFLLTLLAFSSLHATTRDSLLGNWQGILYNEHSNKVEIIYLKLQIEQSKITGISKIENQEQSMAAIFVNKGSYSDPSKIEIQQFAIKKKIDTKEDLCTYNFNLKYTDSTAYLTGSYHSPYCKRAAGNIVLYRSNVDVEKLNTEYSNLAWVNSLQYAVKNNLPAPEILSKRLKNFVFQTIYFDYDKDDIKKEYESYLKSVIDMLNSHTDLRIKIIGHTDSDGSDNYNDDLSQRRAKQIRLYLNAHNIPDDKIVIDYRGERMPAGTNETALGRLKNRRVDFEFI